MTTPVAPKLFDVLIQYAKDIKEGRVKPESSTGETSVALTFSQNFYAQFFQNRMGYQIVRFDRAAKERAAGLRLELKKTKGPAVSTIVLLITWFEKLCEIRHGLLALEYGAGSDAEFDYFHEKYLPTLLERATAWAKAENYPRLEQQAQLTLSELRDALPSIRR